MTNIFNYIDRVSPVHKLTGATKLVVLLAWSTAAMATYDTRFLAILTVLGLLLFGVSKIKLSDVKIMIYFTLIFMVMNNLLVFLFSPTHGVGLYGSETILFPIVGRYVVTLEQLWYHLNLVLKYLATIPIVILFVCTTQPSEFASSLNKIGIKYSIAYSVALALRYIPDIQREYHEISQAQQARGIEMSKKESLVKRLKSASQILVPLILLSMDRIEVISNAMELRSFGKKKKRSWYMGRKFSATDIICMVIAILFIAVSLYLNHENGGRFWFPF